MPWCRDIMRLLDNLQTPTSELASLETRTAFFTLIHSVWYGQSSLHTGGKSD